MTPLQVTALPSPYHLIKVHSLMMLVVAFDGCCCGTAVLCRDLCRQGDHVTHGRACRIPMPVCLVAINQAGVLELPNLLLVLSNGSSLCTLPQGGWYNVVIHTRFFTNSGARRDQLCGRLAETKRLRGSK